jgi:release factor glutamine methyltransferase
MTETWTIGRVVAWAADDFRSRGIESPRLEAELLLAHALDLERMRVILEQARELEPGELTRYRALIQRRRKREPVAYLRGYKEFYGRTFRTDRRALIPRPDTETLVDTALRRTAGLGLCASALDLCTGSGCVAISLARERPTTRVTATDLSADAIALARENALRLGAAFQTRFAVGDLFAPLDPACDRYDLVTANPPYICAGDIEGLSPDIRDFEPRMALDGGTDGLDLVRRIAADAPRFLEPGGVLLVEVGSGQADAVAEMLGASGFNAIERARDYGGHERVVSGERP